MAEIAADGLKTQEKGASLTTVVAASAAGTTFEWYDFFVFGSLTQVISKTFFSGLTDTAGYIAALALFGAGFAFRPIGALVFGRIGDRVGRKGAFLVTKSLVRGLIKQRSGRIINVSSVIGLIGNAGQCNYAASKAGIEGFSRCLATEYAKRGITVNCVAPGFIETDMTSAVVSAAGDKIKSSIPVKRLGQPDDISNAVLFLASDESSYITGQVLKVDGGLTLGGMA